MTQYPLTLKEFKDWLESKGENEIVGTLREGSCCPIANSLLQKIYIGEGNIVDVCYKHTNVEPYFDSEVLDFDNPNWVIEFIEKVDELDNIKEITAKQALEVLNNFLICSKCNKRNEDGTNCGREDCDW